MYSSEYINQHSAYVLISIVQVIKHKGSFKKDVTGGGGYPKMVTNSEIGGGGMFKCWHHNSIFSTFTFFVIFITCSQNFILLNEVIIMYIDVLQ